VEIASRAPDDSSFSLPKSLLRNHVNVRTHAAFYNVLLQYQQ